MLWEARLGFGRDVYVSAMGAAGEPTADRFRWAMLAIVAGGALMALAARRLRAPWRPALLALPSVAFLGSSAMFSVAAVLPCSPGCPIPFSAAFTAQDAIHIVAAVLAFGFAGLAMVQVSFARAHRALGISSLVCGIAIVLIAGAGGLMSLFQFHANLGGWFELTATTVGLGWVAALGVALAVSPGLGRASVAPEPVGVPVPVR